VENDAILQPVQTYRQHNFLEMQQRVEEEAFKSYEMVENGFLYRFPFTFTVPDQLTIHACRHQHQQWSSHNTHLDVPPTMGFYHNGTKGTRLQNLCPENLSIAYAVEVTLKDEKGTLQSKEPWNFASRQISILPLSNINFPSNIRDKTSLFQPTPYPPPLYRKHAHLETLHIEPLTENPITICLPINPSNSNMKEVQTTFPLRVGFIPRHRGSLPQLNKISRRLMTYTTLNAMQRSTHGQDKPHLDNHHVYTSSLPLPVLNMAARIKQSTTGSQSSRSEVILQVPVSLPLDVKLMPSFDSCLISRSYTLELCLSWGLVGSKDSYSSTLEIPLEIKVTR